MHESSKTDDLKVADGGDGFTEVAAQPYIGDVLGDRVRNADVVFVPESAFREHPGPFFPQQTEEFFAWVSEHIPVGVEVEAAVEDDDFRELGLHSELIILAHLLVTEAALPITLGVISNYVWARIHSPHRERAVRVSLTVVDDKKSRKRTKTFTYEGTPENFPEACEKIERLWKSS